MLLVRLSPSNSSEFLPANNLIPRQKTVATNCWYLDPKIENIKEYENDMCIRVEIYKKKKNCRVDKLLFIVILVSYYIHCYHFII